MNPVSPLPAIIALLVALLTAFLLTKKFGVPSAQGRFSSIDGLRGYLAFFVFLHHASVWYFYLRTGQWGLPPSNLYTHFGQSSVAFFFMITGFLFFSKLIDGRTRQIDWTKLYVSRILRLVPLYLVFVSGLLLVVASLSKGIWNEPIPQLCSEIARWLGFTVLGSPDINGIQNTATIVAKVTWSLRYEWIFYFSLPALALLVGAPTPRLFTLVGIASIGVLLSTNPQIHHLLSFLGGIIASVLARWDRFREFAANRYSSILLLGCLTVSVFFFPSAYALFPILLLSAAFALIASGNSIFGILSHPVSRMLGELSYGIYLLHGILLFAAFNFALGLPEARALSPTSHWLMVAGLTPILITTCFISFRIIEFPAMQQTPAVTAWLRSRAGFFGRRRAIDGPLP